MIRAIVSAVVIICFTTVFSLIATFASLIGNLRLFYWVPRTWAKISLRVSGVSLSVVGAENVKPGATYVFAANHASMFDIFAVLAGVPIDVNFILKKELTRVPLWGWGLAVSPYIIIDRANARKAMASLNKAEQRIRSGASVIVFPEGTRTATGAMQPFKRGAFTLASRAGAPVVPVTINGSFRVLPKTTWKIRPGHIDLIIKDPVASEGVPELELRERVEERIKEKYRF